MNWKKKDKKKLFYQKDEKCRSVNLDIPDKIDFKALHCQVNN